MPPILYAIPFFLLCIGIELLISYKLKKEVYRLHDSVTSLNIGAMSEILRGLTKLLTVVIYAVLVERVGTFTFDTKNPFVWVFAYVLYDFFYYWAHRAGHEVNFLWAAHVVHHSSEDYNLSTALRQSSTNTLFYWVFYVPMAVIGIPVQVFVTVALLSAIYGFWVHTQLIGKLAGSTESLRARPITACTMAAMNIAWTKTTASLSSSGTECLAPTRKSAMMNRWSTGHWCRSTVGIRCGLILKITQKLCDPPSSRAAGAAS